MSVSVGWQAFFKGGEMKKYKQAGFLLLPFVLLMLVLLVWLSFLAKGLLNAFEILKVGA